MATDVCVCAGRENGLDIRVELANYIIASIRVHVFTNNYVLFPTMLTADLNSVLCKASES